MNNKPQNSAMPRRSLGRRISLSYTGFLLGSFLWQAAALTLIFCLCVFMNCSAEAKKAVRGRAKAGESIIVIGTDVVPPSESLQDRRMLSVVDSCPALVLSVSVEGGRAFVACDLRAALRTGRTLLLAWAALELIRVWVLLKRGEKISRRALKPITEIAETARRLSASNLSERIELHGAKNELLDLSGILNDMLDRIESAYNTQKQFVSDASHELRTPIAVIQGYADMLDRWGKSDPEVMNEAISAIRSEAAGMKDLVEQLLFIARHDNSTAQYEMIYFDVSEMVDETFRDTRLIAGRHHIKYGDMHRAIVMGDRSALKQALRIFVDNALKYTPEGGVIELSCRKEEKYCRITVSDTGEGVAEEELPRIFERFYRADQSRTDRADGHGLGLSIARIIVRAHKGKLEVQSRKGVGSKFHILLPL